MNYKGTSRVGITFTLLTFICETLLYCLYMNVESTLPIRFTFTLFTFKYCALLYGFM